MLSHDLEMLNMLLWNVDDDNHHNNDDNQRSFGEMIHQHLISEAKGEKEIIVDIVRINQRTKQRNHMELVPRFSPECFYRPTSFKLSK